MMARGRYRLERCNGTVLGSVLMLAAVCFWPTSPHGQENVARVGVLAFRGPTAAEARWRPLIQYLRDAVPGWRFELVPVTLISTVDRLEANQLDFVITNPGHYVTLSERFSLSALATRERRHLDQETGLLHYGTAIFTRSDRDEIETLADLKGRTLAAVSPDAFGGFQMAWFEFRGQGLDPFTDLETIRYKGFPQDQIVADVLAGIADAGVVRSGLLEAMAHEGRLELNQVKVLLGYRQAAYPFLLSSRLYPEWSFAARLGTDRRLAEAVTMALLRTQDQALAKRYGLPDLWSAPLSYDGVRAVIRVYQNRDKASDESGAESNTFWLIATIVSGLAGLGVGFFAWRFGSRQETPPHEASDTGVSGDVAEEQRERFDALTRREREVLRLICGGESTKRIAEMLHISPKTVEYHRANLLQKTGAGSTPRMVQLATKLGFDQTPSLGETQ